MFTSKATDFAPTRLSRWLTATISALALATALSGTAAAFAPTRDLPEGSATSVTPSLHDRGIESPGWLEAKLRTTAGYTVLVLE